MDLARVAWLVTVGVLLITVLVLVLQGYYGYAGVTFAVALAAAITCLEPLARACGGASEQVARSRRGPRARGG